MALYKRSPGGPWWTRFTVRGQPIRRSCRTTDRTKAEEYETSLRARFWRQVQLGEQVHTWREAVTRYRREAIWRKNTRDSNERALKILARLDHVAIAAINVDVVEAIRKHLRPRGPAATNRALAVLRGVLKSCVRWGWLSHAPAVTLEHIPEREPNWLTPDQCTALLMELPEHTRAPALFSALTGLRMSNTRDLTWDRVDLDRGHLWIPSSHYKSKRTHSIPLDDGAVRLLRSLPRVGPYVFTYKGEKIAGTFNTKAFRKARERAGVTCRWHDLRHTFASWLAAQNASDRVLQAMCGWTSPKMASRYAHLRSADLRPWASAVGTNAVTALEVALSGKPRKSLKKLVPEIGIEPTTPSLRMTRATKKTA
jgi:integrase